MTRLLSSGRARVYLLLGLLFSAVLISGFVRIAQGGGGVPVSATINFQEGDVLVVSPPQSAVLGTVTGVLLDDAQALEAEIKALNPSSPNLKLHIARMIPLANFNYVFECYPVNSQVFAGLTNGVPPFCSSYSPNLTWNEREGLMIRITGTNLGQGGSFVWPGEEFTVPAIYTTSLNANSISLLAVSYADIPTPLQGALDLILKLESEGADVLQVAEWDKFSEGFVGYTGTVGQPFALVPGDAYAVEVTTGLPPGSFPGAATISGTVFVNDDLSGSPAANPRLAGRVVTLVNTTTSAVDARFTDSQGQYSLFASAGTYNLTVVADPAEGFVHPNFSNPLTVAASQIIPNQHFYRNKIHDLGVDLFPVYRPPNSAPCPGVVMELCVRYANRGDFQESLAKVELQLPPSTDITYLGTQPSSCFPNTAPLTLNAPNAANLMTWDVWDASAIARGASCALCVEFQVKSTVPLNTPMMAEARVFLDSTPTADGVTQGPSRNQQTYSQPVACAFDPNDKQVTPAGCGFTKGLVGQQEQLTYLVRFQNQGNAPATNVRVRDVLHADFDPGTIQIVSSSHPLSAVTYNGQRILEFIFLGINLPCSSDDPGCASPDDTGSNGFVRFRATPRAALTEGTEVNNVASILFDLADPVVTNVVRNTVTSNALPPDGIPTNETCNNVDDDCDGFVDGFATQCGVGECRNSAFCVAGVDQCVPFAPTAEVCDGLDNDCDGIADDGFGGIVELCNGVDENCNGLVDEGNPEGGGSCTVAGALGACAQGHSICDASATLVCLGPGPRPEICANGLDDDCDGVVDELDDSDADGVDDCTDNCADAFNPGQEDADSDGAGDVCDWTPFDDTNPPPGDVGDTVRMSGPGAISWGAVPDADRYNVYRGYRPPGRDFEYNYECLADSSVSGITATEALTPLGRSLFFYLVSAECFGTNAEGTLGVDSNLVPRPIPFVCPPLTRDADADGIEDPIDNCPGFQNPPQRDVDTDSNGDVCDNCVDTPNPGQSNLDGDSLGDACDPDVDGDSILDDGDSSGTAGDNPCPDQVTVNCDDNCPTDANPGQEDTDGDGLGDVCDPA